MNSHEIASGTVHRDGPPLEEIVRRSHLIAKQDPPRPDSAVFDLPCGRLTRSDSNAWRTSGISAVREAQDVTLERGTSLTVYMKTF